MPQTPLEAALSTIINVFNKYAMDRNGTYVLTMDDFTKLVTQEMPDFLKSLGIDPSQASSRDQIQNLFKELDVNRRGFLNLEAFVRFAERIVRESQMAASSAK